MIGWIIAGVIVVLVWLIGCIRLGVRSTVVSPASLA